MTNLLESECPICGGKEIATGVTELRDGQTYHQFRCTECQSVGFEWAKEWETNADNSDVQA